MFGNAEAYERFMGRWSRLVAPKFVDFALPRNEGRVLDVGSGTGALAFAVAGMRTGARVVGIDPSTEYVGYANSRNPYADRVGFRVGDAQMLEFSNSSFDATLSLLVFNFIPDPAKALREVRRVTRPGGAISAAVWDYSAGMGMLRTFWNAAVAVDPAAGTRDEKHMPLCRTGELTKLWEKGGLKNIHEQPLDTETRFLSFPDYWDAFLLGQGPAGAYLVSLDRGKRQALRSELKRRLSVSEEDKPISLPARVWAVRGEIPESA